MYSREQPSPRYRDLLEQYRRLHVEGERRLGLPASHTFNGQSLLPQAGRIKAMIERLGAATIFDYGCGKGQQYQPMQVKLDGVGEWPSIQAFWGVREIRCYDPGYEPFSTLPDGKFDGVICTDVLEHCPEEDIPWILDELFRHANRFVFANVACYPAKKHLPNGENAHCTVRPKEWWQTQLRDVSARYPGVSWEVWLDLLVPTPQGPQIMEQKISQDS